MKKSWWKVTRVLVVVLVSMCAEASLSRHMNDFITVVRQVEDGNPELEPEAVLKMLRRAAGLNDELITHFLGDAGSGGPEINSDLSVYIRKAVHHSVTEDAKEEGVVLTSDGTTVSLMPLLLGIEAGVLSKSRRSHQSLYQVTLAKDLDLSFSQNSSLSSPLGSDGFWNNVSSPQVFTLFDSLALLTTAQVHGGMDGVLLGMEAKSRSTLKLSSLLTEYYCHQLDSEGMDAAPRLISRRRRENFRRLVSPQLLARQVVKSAELQRKLKGRSNMDMEETQQLMAVVEERMRDFVHVYMVCPYIVPRSSWGAAPYRGTPTYLRFPLTYLFIHHTASPSQPCVSFDKCAQNMRSMQSYHQNTNGWADIGYSFVVGGDGNIYEGRGWNWRGAHTYNYNSKGYGVSFIGDYTARLPSQSTMQLVRDQLTSCAVGNGRLKANYILKGHRQVTQTSCPGDTLYREINSWKHFG